MGWWTDKPPLSPLVAVPQPEWGVGKADEGYHSKQQLMVVVGLTGVPPMSLSQCWLSVIWTTRYVFKWDCFKCKHLNQENESEIVMHKVLANFVQASMYQVLEKLQVWWQKVNTEIFRSSLNTVQLWILFNRQQAFHSMTTTVQWIGTLGWPSPRRSKSVSVFIKFQSATGS